MERLTMFERLLTLPIFQGLDINELAEVMRHVRLDFVKYAKGDEVVCQGDASRSLICVINGTLSSTLRSDDGKYTLHERELADIRMIEPYNMFGMSRRYSRTYAFATEGEILTLDRDVFINHILNSQIVKINMMGIVCNKYQKTQRLAQSVWRMTVAEKIVHFVRTMAASNTGCKQLRVKMTDLAEMLQETRLNVSQALNALQNRGLLTLSRGTIDIHALEAMI